MSVGITSHVLDISSGRPAVGVRIDLFRLEGGVAELLRSEVTNTDGRLPGPMLSGEDFTIGTYELLFHVGDYFREKGVELAGASISRSGADSFRCRKYGCALSCALINRTMGV